MRRALLGKRLSTRIVALSLGLLLAVQAAGFIAIRASIDANARATLAEELAVGERVWRQLLEQKAQALRRGAALLAADFAFREAVATGDAETLGSALMNHGARIGASVGVWVDTAQRAVAAFDGDQTVDPGSALHHAGVELTRGARGSGVVLLGQRAFQFVSVPLQAPVTIGWLTLGFPIDQASLEELRAVSGLHAVLLVPHGGADAASPSVATLPPALARELAQHAAASHASGAGEAVLGGEAMLLSRIDLGATRVVLLRSVDAALEPYRQLQWTLALITAGGVLFFGLGSVLTARHVTTPLRALVRAAQRLGRGEYAQPLEHTGRPDEIGELAQAFDAMRNDIAAHEQQIRELAFRDRLTGLPNRESFRAGLQRQIEACAAGGAGAAFAVVVGNLDRFKHVNDVLGYALGDRLLQAVAQRLRAAAPPSQMLARLSSDEFALLLPGADAALAEQAARHAAQSLQEPLRLDDHAVDVGATFGIACWPQHGLDADALLSRSEVAMHAAKRRTAPWLVYDAAIDMASAQTLSLLTELRRAIEQGELRLFLQPKVRLASGALIGAEALVRWQHPTRGMVPPLEFIPFAEQTGFVRQITLWAFDEAARQWQVLQALGLQRLAVNLSTRDLMDVELPDRLGAILARRGVTPDAFSLEITESAVMDEPQRALAVLQALHVAGFKLSIDDFGTGYSSLAYLKRLPVDELKIDKSFVMGMETDPDDAKIVRSTIDLAHNLGLSVVAEGVESAGVWSLLRSLACDEVQGYHLSRPLPLPEFIAFAHAWAARTEAPPPTPRARLSTVL